jgi:hypothetical protein
MMIFFFVCSPLTFSPDTAADGPGDENPQAGKPDDHQAEKWSMHCQAAPIAQHHGSFYSEYEGQNSLPDRPETLVG